jgi:hypothetical protein
MLFTSPSLPLPPGPELPASVVLSWDSDAPASISASMDGGAPMTLSAYHVASDFGALLAAGAVSVVLPPLPPEANGVIAANLVSAGAVKCHFSNGDAVWSPSWHAASVEHDGCGNVRVVDGDFVKAL